MPDHELASLIDDLKRGYAGDAWHGPPLRKILDGVTAEVASARPIPGGHSIWELVVHLSSWEDVVVRRIEECRAIEAPDGGDFPPVGDPGPEAWEVAVAQLDSKHEQLLQTISQLDAARLRETVAGKDYPIAHMIRGVVQHMAYHAGQIAVIKKLAEPQAG
jgi:uncharacterized damage-inducible protein DinB